MLNLEAAMNQKFMAAFSFSYRIPPNCVPTDEPAGYTKWHLLAASMLQHDEAVCFLKEAGKVPVGTVIDDLRESMTFFPDYRKVEFELRCPHAEFFDWTTFQTMTAWKNTLGITVALQTPLLASYRLENSQVPKVVQAFAASSKAAVLRSQS